MNNVRHVENNQKCSGGGGGGGGVAPKTWLLGYKLKPLDTSTSEIPSVYGGFRHAWMNFWLKKNINSFIIIKPGPK